MRRLAALVVVLTACTATGTPVDGRPSNPTEPPSTSAEPADQVAGESSGEAAPGSVFGSPGIGDRLYPALGNGGYDVERYRFDVNVSSDWVVDAVAEIDLVPLAGLSGFNLDLAGLEVISVEVQGFDDVRFEHRDRELIIDLGSVAPEGEELTAVVSYAGTPESLPADAVPFRPGWQVGDDVAYLFSQPDGAQSLFPVNDHPRDRADVVLTITAPSGVEAISGGSVVAESIGEQTDTVTWEMDDVAPYLIPLAIGQLTLVDDRVVNGVRYDVWVSDDLVEASAVETFTIQPEIVAFFEERFGPYPFDRAGALIVDDVLGAALETQTIPTYTAVSAGWGEVVIAHELAHQWFGDAIALEQWDDIWLNEGFATFAHWLWLEESFGADRYDSEVERAYRVLSGLELAANGVTPDRARARAVDAFPPPNHPRAADLFNRSVYERGALGLVALREAVGDERLFDLLGTYTSRFAGETVTTESFLELVEEVLGGDERALLASWVDEDVIPSLLGRGLAPPG